MISIHPQLHLQVKLAKKLAYILHKDHFRRDAFTPYTRHIEDVAGRVGDKDYATQAMAWLHDAIEDTSATASYILDFGVCKLVVDGVVSLTHLKGESYYEYIFRQRVDQRMVDVKTADMLSNLADTPTDRQIIKYAKGLLWLRDIT